MGNEIDRLDVKIEAEASDANKELDETVAKLKQILAPLNDIMNSNAFVQLKEQSKEINKSMQRISKDTKAAMQNVSASIEKANKPMQESVKKVSESLEEIRSRYKDLGKDFQFFGSAESAQKQIEKYSNALETAKLKKAELEATGKTEGQMYEYAIRDIQKYSNMIDALKAKLDTPVDFKGNLSLMGEQELDNWFNNLPSIKAQAEQAAQSIKGSFEQIKEPLKEIDMTLANFAMKATNSFSEPKEESNNFANTLKKLKDTVYGIQERFLEFKGRLENVFVSTGLKTYTSQYTELQNEINKTEKTLATLNAQLARSRETVKGFGKTTAYRKMQYDIAEATKELQRLREEQDKLEVSGGATQWNFKGLSEGLQNFKKSLQPLGNALKNLDKKITSFVKKLRSIIFPAKSAKKSVDGFHKSLSGGLMTMLKYGLGIRSLHVLFNCMRSAITEGFQNFALYSDKVNSSISLLMNTINQLKNSVTAMVAPILNAAAPALNYLIQLSIKATNAVNQLISALLGNDTWIRAKKLTQDYRDTIQGVKDDVAEATKTILGFDQLNVLNGKNKTASSGTTDLLPGDMFETLPVESKFKDLADKIKGILAQLFAPLKAAWDNVGQKVIAAWKYALDEIWALIKSIGSDFLEVWQQEKTIKIFEDILHIIKDIGLVVGNLARNFHEAWEENETGKKILEGIRDIIGAIVKNIRYAADATVEWSANLDFSPLLTKVKEWVESLVPVFDNLSGIVTDFYEKVLLPLGKWTIEEGLPDLLQVFIDFNEKVDWEALRERLAQFWEHLEPFAETVGEGLILFIERVSNALANFVNSKAFDNFLTSVENWMDNVDAEDVADALEKIAEALLAFKVGGVVYKALTALVSNFQALAAIGTVAATVYVGVEFSKDFKEWKNNIDTYGWDEGRRITAVNNPANPYRNGTAITQEDGTGVFDVWLDKLKEWQAQNRATREQEQAEFDVWYDNLKTSVKTTLDNIKSYWSEKWNGVQNWYNENIAPWFTQDRWNELWESVKTAFSTKWQEIVGWWNESAIGKWWSENVTPWFEIDSWSELFSKIHEALSGVWSSLVKWWNESAIGKWWNDNVLPWFEESDWSNLYSVISKALESVWNGLVEWWENSTLGKWWEENVSPWFEEGDWSTLFGVIKTTLKGIWDETAGQWISDITDWWDNDVAPWFDLKTWTDLLSKIPGIFLGKFNKAKDNAVGAIKEMYDKIVGWVDDMISKIQGVIDKMKEAVSSKSSSSSSGKSTSSSSGKFIPKITIPTIKIPTIKVNIPKYATGGFPEDGLFMANHGELLGKFANGKTAVANNEQIITGIENAVYRAMMSVAQSGSFGGNGNIMVNAVLKTENDEVLARAVTRGQEKLDRRYKPSAP